MSAPSASRPVGQDSFRTGDLQALVSTTELHRLLESAQRETNLQRSASRTWRADAAEQVGLLSTRTHDFAQYALPLEDVQRWLMENGASVGPSSLRASAELSSGSQAPVHAALRSSYEALSFGSNNGTSNNGTSSSGRPKHYDFAVALPVHTTSSEACDEAERTLSALEQLVIGMATQAVAIGAESRRLRSHTMVDSARIDALLVKLRLALETVGDLSHGSAEAVSQSYEGGSVRVGNEPSRRLPGELEAHAAVAPSVATLATHTAPCGATTTGAVLEAADPIRASRATGRRQNHKLEQTRLLTSWFDRHRIDPYPSPEEKFMLAQQTGMTVRQIEHCARSSPDRWLPDSPPRPFARPKPTILRAVVRRVYKQAEA